MLRWGRAVALAAWAGGAAVHEGQAQGRPLSAAGGRNLNFGAVFPGVPEIVRRTETARAGRFNLRGTNRAEVQITFSLPVALTASGGRTMPLAWGPNDGGWNTANNINTARAFDPRVPLVTRLSNGGRLFLFLGGTALPASTQRSGTYTATVTLTAAYTGN
jgi:hypothetical protein